MKKLIIFECALCMRVCAMALTSYYVYTTDGSSVKYTIANVDSISFTAPAVGIENGHEYVDLGLPSGTKWATCNVGATAPEAYGDYYAWGETAPKSSYSSDNYSYSDNPDVLPLDKDAARANWGGTWRMPTDEEWTELRENCEWTWTDDYNGTGVAGRIVTSKTNSNSIFLPAAGFRSYDDLNDAGYYGYYWSSSLLAGDPLGAWYVSFDSYYVSRDYGHRFCGRSVRPVLK